MRDEFAGRSALAYPYELEMHKTGDGKCVFLKDGLCTIYAVRPLICQFYPFSLKQDKDGNLVFGLDTDCTGVSTASPLVRDAHYQALMESARAAFFRNKSLTRP
jgi:Fe-S-cluster containining protein